MWQNIEGKHEDALVLVRLWNQQSHLIVDFLLDEMVVFLLVLVG